jgi:hypothetical protein
MPGRHRQSARPVSEAPHLPIDNPYWRNKHSSAAAGQNCEAGQSEDDVKELLTHYTRYCSRLLKSVTGRVGAASALRI